MCVSNSLWMDMFARDLESIDLIEGMLDIMVESAKTGDYDEEFHKDITKDSKELKRNILGNENYDDEKKKLLSSMINSNFKVAKLQVKELLGEHFAYEDD